MLEQPLFVLLLLAATWLCSLVAGFLLAFAVVVMPGIKNLNDREFIRTFQVIDGIIQKRQPVFMCVWIGSIAVLLAAAAMGTGHVDERGQLLLFCATFVYMFGVQLPTLAINVPLNNALQMLEVDAVDKAAHRAARNAFEARWNRSNAIRTILAGLTSAQLIVLLCRY
jgi:uncharacterized membrane protein